MRLMSGSALMNGNTLTPNEGLKSVCGFPALLTIGYKLGDIFNRIVSEVYTIDASHSPENRITGILAPTADRILEMFLTQESENGRPFESLFYACYIAREVIESHGNGLQGK